MPSTFPDPVTISATINGQPIAGGVDLPSLLPPDLLAALDVLPFAVRDFIVRSSADLARTVSRGGSSGGYYFGLCYGAILGVQVRRELPQDVVDALLRRVDQIYNPADSQE